MKARLLFDADISAVISLWKRAFPNDAEFFETFKAEHFNTRQCIGLFAEERLVSAFYFFPAELRGRRFAYIYALATDAQNRGRGFAAELLKKGCEMLASLGFSGALLCPQTESLFGYYKKQGFCEVIYNDVFEVSANGAVPCGFAELSPEEFLSCRPDFLPQGYLANSKDALHLFATYGGFARCADALFAYHTEGERFICDFLLGNRLRAAEFLAYKGFKRGVFKTAGDRLPYALALSFDGAELPRGFGLELM